MRSNRSGFLVVIALLIGAPAFVSAQSLPICPVTPGSPLVAGCTNAFASGRVEPNLTNSPGETTLAFEGQQYLYGFSQADDAVVWRNKYFADSTASAALGILRTQSIVSGRFEPDLLDQPRLGNAFAQSAAWYYDRLTITVDGVPFGTDALIHASLLPVGVFGQVYDNLLGPADGYTLTPQGLFAVDLGASQFQSTDPSNSANDLGRVALNVQYNSQGFAGDRVQHALRTTEASSLEPIAGNPFQQPIDFVIRFKSGVPFYLKARSTLNVSLEMTTFAPLRTQPLGSISDLHGSYGNSIYWNGLSNAKVAGVPRTFSVSSFSGKDWAATNVPLPEPQVALGLALSVATLGATVRARRKRRA